MIHFRIGAIMAPGKRRRHLAMEDTKFETNLRNLYFNRHQTSVVIIARRGQLVDGRDLRPVTFSIISRLE